MTAQPKLRPPAATNQKTRRPRSASTASQEPRGTGFLTVALTACVLLTASLRATPVAAIESAVVGPKPILLREVFVPYEAFHELRQKHPDGIVMDLSEYRQLVLEAEAAGRPDAPVVLPPLKAAVLSANYKGTVHAGGGTAHTARFRARLIVQVTGNEWTLCDLGPALDSVGTVTVDGTPGWLLLDSPAATSGKRARRKPVTTDGHAYLVVRGAGRHDVELTFSLPVRESNEELSMEGALIQAASASLELTVPGRAKGTSSPAVLHTLASDETTRFRLALGSASQFELRWRGRRTVGENPALLAAEHGLAFLPRQDQPRFVWNARVRIGRQSVDRLVFREPAGATVVAVQGDLFHSWARTDAGLEVLLKEAVEGRVQLRLEGFFELDGDRFEISPPALFDAYSNRGSIGLVEHTSALPADGRIAIETSDGFEEITTSEGSLPALGPGEDFVVGVFRFRGSTALLRGSVEGTAALFETRAADILRVTERGVQLFGRLQAQPIRGRIHQLALNVPAPWKLVALHELHRDNRRTLRYEEIPATADAAAYLHLDLDRAATQEHPLELGFVFENADFSPERDWDRRNLDLTLPTLRGAARTETLLGISLSSSLDLETATLPGWKSLSTGEGKRLGLDQIEAQQNSSGIRAVAALRTEADVPSVQLVIGHRAARGEYRSVTHVLAAENRVRIRCDLRLAIVDRGVEELTFQLPQLPEDTTVQIESTGKIKERVSQNPQGLHTIRFVRPWRGSRQFRIEYEMPHVHGEGATLPQVRVAGTFGSERFLVLQSRGAVEVTTTAGPGLATVDWDDIPDFAAAWDDGRVLNSYRFRENGAPGSLSTTLHESAPILSRLARHLKLTTIVGADGTTRTQAEALLAYSRSQYLTVELPQGSRFLAAHIDGEPVHAVRTLSQDPSAVSERTAYAIPLPPQSYATVTFVYEESALATDRAAGNRQSLGAWGTWRGVGPVLRGIPVGETTWRVFHPEGYRFHVVGGNLRSSTPQFEARDQHFAQTFFGRILGGSTPRSTVMRSEFPVRPKAPPPTPSTGGIFRNHELLSPTQSAPGNRLVPRQEQVDVVQHGHQATSTRQSSSAIPLCRLLPQGRLVETTKIGGTPVLELSYWTFARRSAATKGVFLATILLGALLGLRRGRGTFWRFTLWGLALGTALPTAFSWESPLLMIPFCEGLVALACGGLALWGGQLLAGSVARRRQGLLRTAASSATLLPVTVLTVTLLGITNPQIAQAREKSISQASPAAAMPTEQADAARLVEAIKRKKVVPVDPFDVVWIPYNPQGFPVPADNNKAYLSEKRFRELWKLAHPEAEKPQSLPFAYVLGNARYTLRLLDDGPSSNDSYRLQGTLPLHVFSDRWVTIQLPFDQAQLSGIDLDGLPQGVSQKDGKPTLELRGAGPHELRFSLVGKVDVERGRFRVASRLLGGAAATVDLELPALAEVKRRRSGPTPVVRAEAERTLVTVDLGRSANLEIEWSFPQRSGEQGSQLESLSYTGVFLQTDGAGIGRRERLKVTGQPIENVEYAILGDWEIADVQGPDLAEWTIDDDPERAGGKRLHVFFSRPVSRAELGVYGQAVFQETASLPALALVGAVRAETYIGLHRSEDRKFQPNVLTGMQRASYADVVRIFSLPEGESSVYHAYGSGEGETLATANVAPGYDLQTDGVAVLKPDRLLIFVRSRFARADRGPLRHEVELPSGWTVRQARSSALQSWRTTPTADGTRLIVEFTRRPEAGTEIIWSAEQALDAPTEALALPFLSTITPAGARVSHAMRWALAADRQLGLATSQAQRWERLALAQAPTWVTLDENDSYRFAYKSKWNDATLVLRSEPLSTELTATTVSFARVSETALHINTRVVLHVRQGGQDRFRLRLPADAQVESLETTNQQSRSITPGPNGVVVDVRLQSPVTGVHTLDLAYRVVRTGGESAVVLPLSIEDGASRPTPLDAYVGVVQTARTFTLNPEAIGMQPIELNSMPYLPDGVSHRSLLGAYRATTPVWSLRLVEDDIEVATRFDAVLELVDLLTVVGKDGTTRTRVTYTLRKESLQFLGVELPAGTELWGVTVNGTGVAVGRESDRPGEGRGDALRIPVDEAGKTDLPVEIRLYYEQQPFALPSLRGEIALNSPRLLEGQSVQVLMTLWSVRLPGGYWVSEAGGTMRQVPTSLKHAEKVKQLLEKKKKVLSVARSAESRRVRERAQRDLARLEQSLGDNLAELEGSNRSSQEQSQAEQIGKKDLARQWRSNDDLILNAQIAQKEIRLERKKSEDAQDTSADERAFQDRTNFLRQRAWHKGSGFAKTRRPPPGRGSDARHNSNARPGALLRAGRFSGWHGLTLAAPAPEAEELAPQPIRGNLLAPLPEGSRQGAALGLDTLQAPGSSATYTFRHTGGEASVRLVLTRKAALPRYGAGAFLVVLAGILVWRRRRGR